MQTQGSVEASRAVLDVVESQYGHYRNAVAGFNLAGDLQALEHALNCLYQWDVLFWGYHTVADALNVATLTSRIVQIREEVAATLHQYNSAFQRAQTLFNSPAWQPNPFSWPVAAPAAFSPPPRSPVAEVYDRRQRMMDYTNRLRDHTQKGMAFPLAQLMARTEANYWD